MVVGGTCFLFKCSNKKLDALCRTKLACENMTTADLVRAGLQKSRDALNEAER